MLLLSIFIVFSIHTAYVSARNETIHACELVVKCFQEADIELLQCQSILAVDGATADLVTLADELASNETAPETRPQQSSTPQDDCMGPIKQKMQQKKTLMEQRAQAFATCLNERMDRGPEDVDQRKFRYCNTVISRYNARTTAPPEFTLLTTPKSDEESTAVSQQHVVVNATTGSTITTRALSTSNVTRSSGLLNTRPSTVSSLSTPANARLPRQAPSVDVGRNPAEAFAAVAAAASAPNATNGEAARPPAVASAQGRRPGEATTPRNGQSTTSTASTTRRDPAQGQPAQPATGENEAGRVGAVPRFAPKGQTPPTSEDQRGPSVPKNGTQSTSPSSPTEGALEAGSTLAPPSAVEPNAQNGTQRGPVEVEAPVQQEGAASDSPLGPVAQAVPSSPPNIPGAISPPAGGPPSPSHLSSPQDPNSSYNESLANGPWDAPNQQPELQLSSNFSGQGDNETSGALPVLVQQQEQQEVGIVKASPLDQPSIDAPPQELNSGKVALAGTASPIPQATAEQQRNRAETVRESRRRVSEFKACMAKARIQREECKPMVNCCPDSVKCHLRYELSELHDQIHRLELEISEGRQACLIKKKVDDKTADALDQIDEEDLVSDESVVSQQVF